jgi:hypothetical protein
MTSSSTGEPSGTLATPNKREESLFAKDISNQLRRRIGDLRVLSKLRRRGNVHDEPHDVAHAVQRT